MRRQHFGASVQEGVRLMGFGHRVYKNYAPRLCFEDVCHFTECLIPTPLSRDITCLASL